MISRSFRFTRRRDDGRIEVEIDVYVFRDIETLHRCIEQGDSLSAGTRLKRADGKVVAQIYFAEDRIDAENIIHEAFHAAVEIARRRGYSVRNYRFEEKVAYLGSELSTFMLTEFGLIKPASTLADEVTSPYSART